VGPLVDRGGLIASQIEYRCMIKQIAVPTFAVMVAVEQASQHGPLFPIVRVIVQPTGATVLSLLRRRSVRVLACQTDSEPHSSTSPANSIRSILSSHWAIHAPKAKILQRWAHHKSMVRIRRVNRHEPASLIK
jgi:hypothetical protein